MPPDRRELANLLVVENIIKPMTAASAAITRPAPSNQGVAAAHATFPVCQKTKSETNVPTKNAIGNGISMGWIG